MVRFAETGTFGSAEPGPPRAAPRRTLASVFAAPGGPPVQLVEAPAGTNVAVAEAVVHDALAPTEIAAGDVLLGVGVDAAGEAAVELVRHAGSQGAAAVVLKLLGRPPAALIDACRSCGLALATADPQLDWAEVLALLGDAHAGEEPDEIAGIAAGDLFALADAIAAAVGGPATIEDRWSAVLAYSTDGEPIDERRADSILGRRVRAEWFDELERDGTLRRLWASREPVDLTVPWGARRLAVAVRADRRLLGYIWVAEGSRPFRPDAAEALRAATQLAALHLLRYEHNEGHAGRRRARLLRRALEGDESSDVTSLQLPDGELAVLALSLDDDAPATVEAQALRVSHTLALYERTYHLRCVATSIDAMIYVVLPTATRERIDHLAGELVERLRLAGLDAHAGIGSAVAGLRGLPRSRWEAAAAALAGCATDRLLTYIDDVRAQVVLDRVRRELSHQPWFAYPPLERLRDHDAAHGTTYVETLRAYVTAFGNVSAAAALLPAHVNTFRYRLQRLCELSGIDLDDPHQRTMLALLLVDEAVPTG